MEAVKSTDQRSTSTKKTSYLLVGERPEVIEALLIAVGSSSDSQERVRFVDVATSTRETRSAMAEWVREIVSKHANVLAHPINVRVIRAPMHSVDTFRMLEASYDMVVVATANESDLTMIKSVFLRNGTEEGGDTGNTVGNVVLVVA